MPFCKRTLIIDPIYITDDTIISSIDINKGHRYLGMTFVPTNDFTKIININLNDRMSNISKFYAWLQINTDTPIEIKLLVLDSCLFSSMLYAIETWGTLKPLINAPLILATLIFAMRGQNLKVFCDINFCDHENRNILRH